MSQVDVLELVAGLDFPVSQEDLVRQAQERGASTELIEVLRSLRPERFQSADELDAALAGAR